MAELLLVPARTSIAPVARIGDLCHTPASSRLVALEQVETAERLLRLGERPVGHDRLAVPDAHLVADPMARREPSSSPAAGMRRVVVQIPRTAPRPRKERPFPPSPCLGHDFHLVLLPSLFRLRTKGLAGIHTVLLCWCQGVSHAATKRRRNASTRLVEHLVQVAALRALHARRATAHTSHREERRGVLDPALEVSNPRWAIPTPPESVVDEHGRPPICRCRFVESPPCPSGHTSPRAAAARSSNARPHAGCRESRNCSRRLLY